MYKKALAWNLIALFLAFLLANSTEAEVANHVVINEIQVSGDSSYDEFVRLYNPTDSEISLSGWRLQKIAKSGKKYTLVSAFPPESRIPGKDFFTIGHKNYFGQKNLEYSSSSYSIADDNAVVLYSDAGKTEVDRVAFGENSYAEGQPSANPKAGESLKRVPDGEDTDNNINDVKIIEDEEETPDHEHGSAKDIRGVYINEILPNPKSPKTDTLDEWIELFNSTDYPVDLSGSMLKDGVGGVREYTIPEGTHIDSHRYATFYSSATKIVLNNDGDFVELLDSQRSLIDKSPDYGKADDDQSFALFEEGWGWTLSPTPLAPNHFTESENKAEASTKAQKESAKTKAKETKVKEPKEKKAAKKESKDVKGSKAKKLDEVKSENGKIVGDAKALGLSNKTLGIILISLAVFIGINYLVFREKIHEIFKQKFGRNI